MATVTVIDSTTTLSAMVGNVPEVLGPGMVVPDATLTCKNTGANPATGVSCVPSSSAGTVGAATCAVNGTTVTMPTTLGVGQSVVCTFAYTAPGTLGGGANTTTAGNVGGTASSSTGSALSANAKPVNPPIIDAVDDTFSTGSVAGGTTPSVLGNDKVGTTPASVASGSANVTVATNGAQTCTGCAGTPTTLVLRADGTITVPPGATPGTYSVPYEICSTVVPTSCDDAVATVTVTPSAAAITVAKKQISPATPAQPGETIVYQLTATNTGQTIGNAVFFEKIPANTIATFPAALSGATSDCTGTVTGAAACTITIANVPAAIGTQVGTLSATLTVTAATPLASGATIVNLITDDTTMPPAGCTAGAGATCTPSTSCTAGDPHCVSTPLASADMVGGGTSATGTIGSPISVVTTCTNNGPDAATNATCKVTGAPPGATTTCNPPGPVASLAVGSAITCTTTWTPTSPGTVVLTTTAGSATPDPVPNNDATTTPAVIPGMINPVTDSGTVAAGTGGTAIANVAANDTVNTHPAILGPSGNATVAQSGTWPPGITLDPSTGAVNVASTVAPGVYTVPYTLCDKSTPPNCATVNDTVTVTGVVVPQPDSGTVAAGTGGIAVPNVTTNDKVNGQPATLGPSGNATVTQTGTWPPGITLDPASGAVNVAGTVAPGTYTANYQLCDKSTPPNCATTTVTITVTSVATDLMAVGAPTQTVPVNTPVTVVTTCVNNGPLPATNAVCTVTGIPASATGATLPHTTASIAGVSGSPAAVGMPAAAPGTTCTPVMPVANFAVGAVITCTTTFTPTQVGTITLPTTVSSDTPDSNPANNTAPSLVIVIDQTPPTPAVPVPVASRWMLTLLGLLFAAGAMLGLRKRQR